jgi:hypothetical protein
MRNAANARDGMCEHRSKKVVPDAVQDVDVRDALNDAWAQETGHEIVRRVTAERCGEAPERERGVDLLE